MAQVFATTTTTIKAGDSNKSNGKCYCGRQEIARIGRAQVLCN